MKTFNGKAIVAGKNRQVYIKHGRKNGLRSLELLMEQLKGDDLKACKDAYNYLDGCLRSDRAKGKGRYAH